MAGVKISNLPAAGALTGTELVAVVQGGITSQTTAAVIAATSGVTSFAGGTTGLTPASATSGAVTLAGTLAIANGGTNATATPTAGAVPYGTGTAYAFSAAGTSGQVLKSNGASAPTWATVTGTGTVTSVAATVPAFLSVTGSPITAAGTLAIAYSGTALPVANGGTNATTASLTSFNNITGYTASGATGTTSTNLVFSASPTFTGTLAAAAITASTTLGVTGVSTLTGGAVIQGLTVGLGANAVGNNTAVGSIALASNTTGSVNTAVGSSALNANTTGIYNTALGVGALAKNVSGEANVAIGPNTLLNNISGSNNVGIGTGAITNNTGASNIGIGYVAGSALTTGSNNTIIGSVAGTAGLSDTVIIAAGTAERMRIDSTGLMKVLGGVVVNSATTNFTQKFQVLSTTGQPNAVFFKYIANATGPDITFGKSRGTTATAYDAVQNGDTLTALAFVGTDGTALVTPAAINVVVDGAVSAGTVPAALYFATGSSGGGGTKLAIASSGVITMASYGVGTATFSAAGVISSVSDETYKIKDGVVADPMAMIMALEPGYYFGKPEANMGPGRQLGFYAQNVRAAIGPEAAPDPEPSKPWGYFDRSVLAVAIEAIKVLTARIEALEAK